MIIPMPPDYIYYLTLSNTIQYLNRESERFGQCWIVLDNLHTRGLGILRGLPRPSRSPEKPPETSTKTASPCSRQKRPGLLILNQTLLTLYMGGIVMPPATCATPVPLIFPAACGGIRQVSYVFNHLAQGWIDYA